MKDLEAVLQQAQAERDQIWAKIQELEKEHDRLTHIIKYLDSMMSRDLDPRRPPA